MLLGKLKLSHQCALITVRAKSILGCGSENTGSRLKGGQVALCVSLVWLLLEDFVHFVSLQRNRLEFVQRRAMKMINEGM